MRKVEKSVFISYRRTNAPWALAIFQDLTQHGYDVFLDFEGIGSGDFERVILENINARAHFLALLTPSALDQCDDPKDWLRREIEAAMDAQRNIVPLMLEGFDFNTPAITSRLTGKLAILKRYNALPVPVHYFAEAMGRLREKYLNVPLDAVLHPASNPARQTAIDQQAAARTAPLVQERELWAQEWFERGFNAADPDEKLRCYSHAIHLNPDYALAYYNRGVVSRAKDDLAGALMDYTEAIRLKPDDALAYNNRGAVRGAKGDIAGAIEDYTEAIRLRPDDADANYNRGLAREANGDLAGAVKDYTEAIRLRPGDALAYNNRGAAREIKGDLDGAIKDYDEAIRIKPDDALAYYNRGLARETKGDLDGAIKDYNEAIRLKPDDADAYYRRALIWKSNGNYTAAIADFQRYLAKGAACVFSSKGMLNRLFAI